MRGVRKRGNLDAGVSGHLTYKRSPRLDAETSEPSSSDRSSYTMTDVTSELRNHGQRERNRAILFGGLATIAAVGGIALLLWQAHLGFDSLSESASMVPKSERPSDTAIVAEASYLIIRGSGFAAIVGGVIYFGFNLARSALDQATRFEKRFIASQVIDYALHSDVKPERLSAAHTIIEAWGGTVESAYTAPRVAKQVSRFKYTVGKDQATAEEESNQP